MRIKYDIQLKHGGKNGVLGQRMVANSCISECRYGYVHVHIYPSKYISRKTPISKSGENGVAKRGGGNLKPRSGIDLISIHK